MIWLLIAARGLLFHSIKFLKQLCALDSVVGY